MKICNECLLPENFPAIKFDDKGICSYCNNEKNTTKAKARFQKLKIRKREEMLRTIKRIKGKHRHDCLLAFSGGKDSTALLYMCTSKIRMSYF